MHALLSRLAAARPGQQNAAHRSGAGYLAALLSSCEQADTVPLRRRATAPPGLAEPLTDRELEVLRLLAAGKSNQRIARDLVVAVPVLLHLLAALPTLARGLVMVQAEVADRMCAPPGSRRARRPARRAAADRAAPPATSRR